MKKQFLTLALSIAAFGATAQEKVRVHNGTDSYVTEIEYLTFDDADGDAISVSDLQTQNATLEGQISTLTTANTDLAGQITTLTNDKSALVADTVRLYDAVTILNGQITIKNEQIEDLKADTTELKIQVSSLTTDKVTLVADTVRLYDAVTTLNGQIASKNTQIAGLETDTTNLNAELRSLKSAYLQLATNGHAYVDLGLPSGTLWATCNIGATNPEDYGDYFAWGETETYYSAGGDTESPTWKPDYTDGYKWSSYFDTNDNGSTFTKYNNNGGKTELEDIDDVAIQQWGGSWRMPTDDQLKELKNNCYWVWTTKYNGKSVNGYIVYKKKSEGEYSVANDPHIFLPAAGSRYGDVLNNPCARGYYWSRSLRSSSSNAAYYLGFHSSDVDWYGIGRGSGLSVRAVCPGAQK